MPINAKSNNTKLTVKVVVRAIIFNAHFNNEKNNKKRLRVIIRKQNNIEIQY